MNRLLRQPSSRLSGWSSLALFAAVYVAALTLVVVPDRVVEAFGASRHAEVEP